MFWYGVESHKSSPLKKFSRVMAAAFFFWNVEVVTHVDFLKESHTVG
jgi:hypothetical protein